MRCSDFLKYYSDYRDGSIHDPRIRRRLTLHMSRCESCCRYDRAITSGVGILRRESAVEPSERFRVRLRCQLAIEGGKRRRSIARRARRVTSLALSGAVALLVYEGFAHDPEETRTPTVLAPAPMPMVTASPGYPFVTVSQLTAPSLQSTPARGMPALFTDSVYAIRGQTATVLTVQADLPR